ncbi:hypothetical protein D3C72_2068110 [compost metagenome]
MMRLASGPARGRKSSDKAMLKKVCPIAIWTAGSPEVMCTSAVKGPSKGTAMSTPETLTRA